MREGAQRRSQPLRFQPAWANATTAEIRRCMPRNRTTRATFRCALPSVTSITASLMRPPAPSDRVNHNHAPRSCEYQHCAGVAAPVRSFHGTMCCSGDSSPSCRCRRKQAGRSISRRRDQPRPRQTRLNCHAPAMCRAYPEKRSLALSRGVDVPPSGARVQRR